MRKSQENALYESIMRNISKTIKKTLNETINGGYIIWYQDIDGLGNGYAPGEKEESAIGFPFDDNVYSTVDEAEAVMAEYIDGLIKSDLEIIESDDYGYGELCNIDSEEAMNLVKSGNTYALYKYNKRMHMIKYSPDKDDDGCGTVIVSVRPA